MPVIELKKYDDKYLIGIISCLKRNYNRFGCMMDLDVYKFIKPLVTYDFSEDYSYQKGNYGYVLLEDENVVGFFEMIYYRLKSESGKFYTVANPTTWAIDDKYRIYIFQVTEALFKEPDIVIDATPSYKELMIEKKMFGFMDLSLKKIRFFSMESQNKENCYITKVSSSSCISDDDVYKKYMDNVRYGVNCIEIVNELNMKCYVMYNIVFAKKHLENDGDVIKLARVLSVSDIKMFNDLFSKIFNYIKKNEKVSAMECDSMFIENNEILMREHEEKQYTRIKKYNTECDIKNFDLLYTEIALRNEY